MSTKWYQMFMQRVSLLKQNLKQGLERVQKAYQFRMIQV